MITKNKKHTLAGSISILCALRRSRAIAAVAGHYYRQHDFDIAGFLLHQSILQLLQAAIQPQTAKVACGSSISGLLKSPRSCSSRLYRLCADDQNEVLPVVHYLDLAYGNHYCLDERQLTHAFVLLQSLQQELQ